MGVGDVHEEGIRGAGEKVAPFHLVAGGLEVGVIAAAGPGEGLGLFEFDLFFAECFFAELDDEPEGGVAGGGGGGGPEEAYEMGLDAHHFGQ